MANMNVRTPRFYVDTPSYLLSRGMTQNGELDVLTGSNLIGIQTGSEIELFDMNPLNKVDFNTSAATGDHVLVNIDTQSATSKKIFVAILNHNMNSADAKVRIRGSFTETHVDDIDMGSASPMSNPAEVVNADTISSSVVTPATDGSTIVKFDEATKRFWGIQFEGDSAFDGSTDLFIGCILIGEYFDMPNAPDLNVTSSIMFDGVKTLESAAGQRFSNMSNSGRTHGASTKSPFTIGQPDYEGYGGRLAYDMSFSYLNATSVFPNRYQSLVHTDDTVVSDVWNKTNGSHLPFIFSIDNAYVEDDGSQANSESVHMFARFADNSMRFQQVAPDVWNVGFRVEEEF